MNILCALPDMFLEVGAALWLNAGAAWSGWRVKSDCAVVAVATGQEV